MHLWRNFTKQWKDMELKSAVWEAARSSTPTQFNSVMEKVKRKSEKAWGYLNKWPKESWSKAFFSIDPKIDNVCNNTCEGFNSYFEIPSETDCDLIRGDKVIHNENYDIKPIEVGQQKWTSMSNATI
jgi:hypothetical protein